MGPVLPAAFMPSFLPTDPQAIELAEGGGGSIPAAALVAQSGLAITTQLGAYIVAQ